MPDPIHLAVTPREPPKFVMRKLRLDAIRILGPGNVPGMCPRNQDIDYPP